MAGQDVAPEVDPIGAEQVAQVRPAEDVDAHAHQVAGRLGRLLDEVGDRPSASASRMPKRCASSIGTVRTAQVTSASRSPVQLDEGPVVHLVDVVAGEDQDQLRVAVVR